MTEARSANLRNHSAFFVTPAGAVRCACGSKKTLPQHFVDLTMPGPYQLVTPYGRNLIKIWMRPVGNLLELAHNREARTSLKPRSGLPSRLPKRPTVGRWAPSVGFEKLNTAREHLANL